MEDPADRHRRLLDALPEGIVFLFEGRSPPRYTFVGGEGLTALGITPDSLEGQPVAANRPPSVQESLRDHYRAALDGEEQTFEIEAEGRVFRFTIAPLHDDDGDIVRGSGFAQDITEEAVYRDELERQNARLEHVTELLSHDLQNHLQVASGHLDLLRDAYDEDHLDAVEDALDRIRDLTQAELELPDTPPSDRTTVSLETLAQSAWQNVITDDATLEIAGDVRFQASETGVRRILENLFRNSVDHGDAGEDDPLTVRVEPLPDGFAVEDNGTGIPPWDRDAVLEHSYSTAEDNTGLGLFICRRIAEEHGWSVDVTASHTGGARFEFTDIDPVDD